MESEGEGNQGLVEEHGTTWKLYETVSGMRGAFWGGKKGVKNG